ncbi:hypothetical protein [Burkholderia ubonensis]|uniref:hypothetical protein n=1 Tax=Burkholderia ubonensis TaxID=101571 RepID=UPI002FC6E4F3
MQAHLRIARPVSHLAATERMYCDAFGLAVLARFQDHDGFDGVMLGREGTDYHFEFTHCRTRPVVPAPTPEDLIVFYLPGGEAWIISSTALPPQNVAHATILPCITIGTTHEKSRTNRLRMSTATIRNAASKCRPRRRADVRHSFSSK